MLSNASSQYNGKRSSRTVCNRWVTASEAPSKIRKRKSSSRLTYCSSTRSFSIRSSSESTDHVSSSLPSSTTRPSYVLQSVNLDLIEYINLQRCNQENCHNGCEMDKGRMKIQSKQCFNDIRQQSMGKQDCSVCQDYTNIKPKNRRILSELRHSAHPTRSVILCCNHYLTQQKKEKISTTA